MIMLYVLSLGLCDLLETISLSVNPRQNLAQSRHYINALRMNGLKNLEIIGSIFK